VICARDDQRSAIAASQIVLHFAPGMGLVEQNRTVIAITRLA